MNQKAMWQKFSKLSPEAQRQVADFITFLQGRRAVSRFRKSARPTKLAREAFVGMWRRRKDLRDGTAWVRDLREREWGKP